MPELPDVTVYVERLNAVASQVELTGIRIGKPFVLRTVEPGIETFVGQTLVNVSRIGKRIVLHFEHGQCLIIHLMIAGRLRWRKAGAALSKSNGLCAFDFTTGTLLFTEAGKKRRASLHLLHNADALKPFDRGGLDILDIDHATFHAQLTLHNHTLKRALTDQHIFSGVGNAYSDEILHHAKLSPFKQTAKLNLDESNQLYRSCQAVLSTWTTRLREQVGDGFPDKVTAFHEQMAVHGRYGQPCPVCNSMVQRIRYTDNECNYCATCQNDGKLFADRALSRLLKSNWPRTLEELEG